MTINVLHTIYETDFGPYHSWTSSVQASASYNDRERVMAEAEAVAAKLRAVGVPVEIHVTTREVPYPRE